MIKHNILVIIPIRKGSTRLPNKSFLDLGGKPLFIHTVLTALNFEMVDKIVITTDATEEVISVLQTEKLDKDVIVLKREKHLCTKDATSVDVAIDVVKEYPTFDVVLFMEVTMPFIETTDLENMIKYLINNNLPGIFTVNRFTMKPTGTVLLIKRDVLFKEKTLFPKGSGVYFVDGAKNIDVDDYYDFLIANACKEGKTIEAS